MIDNCGASGLRIPGAPLRASTLGPMEIEYGATLTTPDGKVGTVLHERVHGNLTFTDSLARNRRRVEVYALLLESGEVRFYSEAALLEANGGIRRSGSLN